MKDRATNWSRKKAEKRSGTTLVEALVAVVLLAIGIAGASRLIVMTSKLSDLSKEKNTAIQIAKSRIEQIGMADFDDLPSWAVENMVSDEYGHPSTDGRYQINTDVVYVQTNLAQIAVQVHIRNRITRKFDTSPEHLTIYLTDL